MWQWSRTAKHDLADLTDGGMVLSKSPAQWV
jgi:hypothetical protein